MTANWRGVVNLLTLPNFVETAWPKTDFQDNFIAGNTIIWIVSNATTTRCYLQKLWYPLTQMKCTLKFDNFFLTYLVGFAILMWILYFLDFSLHFFTGHDSKSSHFCTWKTATQRLKVLRDFRMGWGNPPRAASYLLLHNLNRGRHSGPNVGSPNKKPCTKKLARKHKKLVTMANNERKSQTKEIKNWKIDKTIQLAGQEFSRTLGMSREGSKDSRFKWLTKKFVKMFDFMRKTSFHILQN